MPTDLLYSEELAVAAAVWNNFKMIRERAENAERDARHEANDARKNEQDAFRRFLDLAEQAQLEPASVR